MFFLVGRQVPSLLLTVHAGWRRVRALGRTAWTAQEKVDSAIASPRLALPSFISRWHISTECTNQKYVQYVRYSEGLWRLVDRASSSKKAKR